MFVHQAAVCDIFNNELGLSVVGLGCGDLSLNEIQPD
jgi:hypothetical protein